MGRPSHKQPAPGRGWGVALPARHQAHVAALDDHTLQLTGAWQAPQRSVGQCCNCLRHSLWCQAAASLAAVDRWKHAPAYLPCASKLTEAAPVLRDFAQHMLTELLDRASRNPTPLKS